jgi:pyruvate dehydrogenase E2 component (dihydrolipoamide acetyltransferase)
MHVREFQLPDVGEGITEAEIVAWLVKRGDRVHEDQDLVEIETDKAVVTLPSPYKGKVSQLYAKEGDVIKVGQVLLSIEEMLTPVAGEGSREHDSGSVVGSLEEAGDGIPSVKAIPSVRAYAKELGVDLEHVKGSGPGGRISKDDVERAAGRRSHFEQETDPYGPTESVALRGIRRTVAKQLSEASKQGVPVTIWEDADITELGKLRSEQRGVVERDGVKLTYLPYVIKAVIPALKDHPYLNARLDDALGRIVLKKYYNIGIAVDTPDGLMVFTIKQADQKTLVDLALELAALAGKARLRQIDLTDLKGSTFTITNYGVVGASYGTPIINYPEVAILGIGKIGDKAVVRDHKVVIRKIMPLSLAFDHRVIDGVGAARFLNEIIEHLENPRFRLPGEMHALY